MKQPQTEDEERACVVYEMGWLTSAIHQLTGQLPALIRDICDRDGGLNFNSLSTEQIADFAATLREEFILSGGSASAAADAFPWENAEANNRRKRK